MSATIPAIMQRTKLPDLVVAVYGNGRCEARVRGSNDVVAEAPNSQELIRAVKRLHPDGFSLDFRYDPHM